MNQENHDHREAPEALSAFSGYAAPTSSTTYTPNQFFDVVLPRASRGCLRLVAYLVRKTLGWSDEYGNPQNPEATVSYRELIENAGIGRGRIKESIEEAIENRYINCLRFGQPHKAGEEGYSALYSLRWHESDEYITDPEEFDGFFAGNGNLTHIPNDFFDHTIPNESLALVKVVGVIIRHTIGFQTKFGFRRQQVEMSFSEIMRRTSIASRSTVNIALKEGIEKNHIRKVSEGFFDPKAGMNSTATTYSVKWSDQSDLGSSEFKNGNGSKIEPGDRFQNRTGKLPTVPKSNREIGSKIEPEIGSIIEPATVPKSNREAFRNRTGIKTTLNNTSKQQQTETVVGVANSLALLVKDLMLEGIEAEKAKELVENHTEAEIRDQLQWLSLRRIRSSRSGLLITAIERKLPNPSVQTSEQLSLGEEFGKAFYEALKGSVGPTLAECTGEDLKQAERLSSRSNLKNTSEAQLGKLFADFVKAQDQSKKTPVRTLSLAVKVYGDDFLKAIQKRNEVERKESQAELRKRHESLFGGAYDRFIESLASELEIDEDLQSRFEINLQDKVKKLRKLSEKAAQMVLEEAQDVTKRKRLLVEFAQTNGVVAVPGFWEWDRTRNETPFTTEG